VQIVRTDSMIVARTASGDEMPAGGTHQLRPRFTSPEDVVRYGFLFKSPAGRTVVAGVLVDDAGFCEASGVGVAAGRLEFSFVMTESLKS
jgi:hypothetical protein